MREGIRGERAVHRVDEDDAVVLQPLAGVDGGQHEGAGRVGFHALNSVPQLLQPQKERPRGRGLVGQGQQHIQLGRVRLLLPQIVPVAHELHQPLDGGKAGELGDFCVMGLECPHLPILPGLQALVGQQAVEHRLIRPHPPEHPGQDRLFDFQIQLVVEPEEPLPVGVVKGELQHIGDVPDDGAGEEEALPLAAGIGNPLPLQQVDEGQGTVIVAVEDGGLFLAVPRHLQEVVILAVVVRQCHPSDGRALGIVRAHMLGTAAPVALDEGIRRLHDRFCGAVVGLHHQHLGPRPHLVKLQQCLGPRRPEAVDVLILVPHHEDAAGLGRQQAQDGVLNLGRVLGLVHAEIGPAVLEVGQNVRVLPENAVGEHHLIVKVHEAVLQQKRLVALVD